MKDQRTKKIEELKAQNKALSKKVAELEEKLSSVKFELKRDIKNGESESACIRRLITELMEKRGFFTRVKLTIGCDLKWDEDRTIKEVEATENMLRNQTIDTQDALKSNESINKDLKHAQKLLKKEHDLNQSLLRRLLDED